MPEAYQLGPTRSQGLIDILDRILDKGLVIAGDIRVHLANVELLTIQIRLLVCSLDKADEMGMNWWRSDPYYGGTEQVTALNDVTARLERIEQRLQSIEAPKASRRSRTRRETSDQG
ncbi:MAG: gas vesicle protein [Longimicrobiales bacterium]